MISVSDEHFNIITGILKKIVPDYEVRALDPGHKLTAKAYSDLDIAVVGEGKLDQRLIEELKEAFEGSALPFRVNVLDWHGISEEVRKAVEEGYEVIWKGNGRVGVSCSGWKEVKLGDLLNFRRGHDLPKTKMNDGRIPVVGSNGVIGIHDEFTTKAPCLTIGRSGNIGNPYYIDTDCWAHNTTLYVDDFKGNDPKYLYYLLKTLNLGYYGGGSAVPTLNRNHIHPVEVEATVNKIEQKAIAATLSCLDDKIELNNRMNKNMEEIAQAIFKSWFVDFEPFKDGEFEDSELGSIPKGWRVEMVDSIAKDIVCGKTPSTKDKANYGDYMPFITIPDMHGNVYVVKTERYLSQQGVNVQLNKTLPNNSIVVSCIATPGLVALTSKKSQTNQQINSIVCENNISHFYIFLCMKNYSDKIKDLGSGGSTTLNLNKTQFSKIKLIIPTEKVMTEFHKQVEFLFDLILENQNQIDDLIQVRDTLLPKLMSGEINVPFEQAEMV